MVNDSYFQFPLCALAFGQTAQERLNTIIDYSVVEAGSVLFQNLTEHLQLEVLAGSITREKPPQGLSPHDKERCGAFYGSHVIGVTLPDIDSVIRRHDAMVLHVRRFVESYGNDAEVRIKADFLFKARDGYGLTYREFSVLCAIYSAIGNKELAIVRRNRIQFCALGYRTAAIMEAELASRLDGATPLTERQLRDTVDRLHRNKFFARCTVGHRITYYSNRLDNETFRKKVLERRSYPDFFRASQRAQDEALSAAIKRNRCEAAKSEPKTPSNPPRFKFPPTGN